MIIFQFLRNGMEMLLLSALVAYGLRQLPMFRTLSFLRATAGIAVVLDLIATGGTTVIALGVLAAAGVLSRQAWRQRQRFAVLAPLLTRLRRLRSPRHHIAQRGSSTPLTRRFRAAPRTQRHASRTRQTRRAA